MIKHNNIYALPGNLRAFTCDIDKKLRRLGRKEIQIHTQISTTSNSVERNLYVF